MKKSVGEKYLGRSWETSLGQEYWRSVTLEESWRVAMGRRDVLKKTVGEKCCICSRERERSVVQKRDVQRCWREVLEKDLDRKGLERLVDL